MAEILGETQATGRYSFQFADEDVVQDGHNEANIDPALDSAVVQIDDDDDSLAEIPAETQGEKRHRESLKLQPPSKKQKVSGAGAIAEIGSGLHVLADAIAKKHDNMGSTRQTLPQDTVDSTLQGQALEKVQKESWLTTEGQAFMIEFLGADLALARSYVAIKKDELRAIWLKKQIVKLGGNLEEHFIDWNDSQ